MTEAVFSSTEPTPEEVAEAVRGLEVDDLDRYSVKWETEDRQHDTRYDVTHISYRRNRPPTMQIVSGRGGRYLIDPNVVSAAPMIRYIRPVGVIRNSGCSVSQSSTRISLGVQTSL